MRHTWEPVGEMDLKGTRNLPELEGTVAKVSVIMVNVPSSACSAGEARMKSGYKYRRGS